MSTRTLLVVIAIALAAARLHGPAAARDLMDREALHGWTYDQGALYVDAYAAGGLEPILAQLSDDFRFREPDGTMAQGREAYARLIGGYLEAEARLSVAGPHDYGFLSDDTAFGT